MQVTRVPSSYLTGGAPAGPGGVFLPRDRPFRSDEWDTQYSSGPLPSEVVGPWRRPRGRVQPPWLSLESSSRVPPRPQWGHRETQDTGPQQSNRTGFESGRKSSPTSTFLQNPSGSGVPQTGTSVRSSTRLRLNPETETGACRVSSSTGHGRKRECPKLRSPPPETSLLGSPSELSEESHVFWEWVRSRRTGPPYESRLYVHILSRRVWWQRYAGVSPSHTQTGFPETERPRRGVPRGKS